ncbi:MAG: hypothetical protein EPN34_08115 [Burkholderiaceae bacterium]|nr:MAG: hypothetical protein EPN34_08115 [Burkholderiaceae bacterium]
MVGIFAMCEANTPGVGTVLDAAGLTSIPEAHCYLKINGERFDFTGLRSGTASPFESLVTEQVVAPAALAERKIHFHKDAIAAWAPAHGLTAKAAWPIREACIAALAPPRSMNQYG